MENEELSLQMAFSTNLVVGQIKEHCKILHERDVEVITTRRSRCLSSPVRAKAINGSNVLERSGECRSGMEAINDLYIITEIKLYQKFPDETENEEPVYNSRAVSPTTNGSGDIATPPSSPEGDVRMYSSPLGPMPYRSDSSSSDPGKQSPEHFHIDEALIQVASEDLAAAQITSRQEDVELNSVDPDPQVTEDTYPQTHPPELPTANPQNNSPEISPLAQTTSTRFPRRRTEDMGERVREIVESIELPPPTPPPSTDPQPPSSSLCSIQDPPRDTSDNYWASFARNASVIGSVH